MGAGGRLYSNCRCANGTMLAVHRAAVPDSTFPIMPLPSLKIEDDDLGLPRQPVPLRLAYLVTGLSFREFLYLLAVRQEDRYEYLTGFEYAEGTEPREVRRQFYEEIMARAQADDKGGTLLQHLSVNQFVWSDELAAAFSQYVRDYPGEEDAHARGMGLCWTPAWHGNEALIEECVDLGNLATNLTKLDLRKQETEARHERWQQACEELKSQNPDKSDSWISLRIARMDIAEGRDSETIRKNMKRK